MITMESKILDMESIKYLKILSVLVLVLSISGFVSGQDATFTLQEPNNGEEIKVFDGTNTDVLTSVDVDLSSFTSTESFSGTLSVYKDGEFNSNISYSFTGGEIRNVEATLNDLEVGSSYSFNHSLESNQDGSVWRSNTYSFSVIEGSSSGPGFSEYQQQYAISSTNSADLSDAELSENYIVQMSGGVGALLNREDGNPVSSGHVNSDAYNGYEGRNTAFIIEDKGLYGYANSDQNVIVRNIEDGSVAFEIGVNDVGGVASNNNYIATTDSDNIQVFDLQGNQVFSDDLGVSGKHWGVKMSEDFLVASGGGDNTGATIGTYSVPGFGKLSENNLGIVERPYGVDFNDEYVVVKLDSTVILNRDDLSQKNNVNSLGNNHYILLNDQNEVLKTGGNGNLEIYDIDTQQQKTLDSYATPIVATSSSNNGFVAKSGSTIYLYESPELVLENLKFGNYNYNTGGIDEKSNFIEPESFQSSIDYVNGNDADGIDFFIRPESGWNPTPEFYNETTWASFSNVNLVGNDEDNKIETPIINLAEFPLNQSGTYEIFAGGFSGSSDPSSVSSKQEADYTTATETFELTVEGVPFNGNIEVVEPVDTAIYSFQNATDGTIPFNLTVEGEKNDVEVEWLVTNEFGTNVYDGGFVADLSVEEKTSASGTFNIPEQYQVEGAKFNFKANATDGFTTISNSSNFTLEENPQSTGEPTNGEPTNGGTNGEMSDMISSLLSPLEEIWESLINELGEVGKSFLAILMIAVAGSIGYSASGEMGGLMLMASAFIIAVYIGLLPGWILVLLGLMALGLFTLGGD